MKARSTATETPTEQPHVSRVVRIVNLGHQPGFNWEGEDIESEYKIEFTFEVCDENMKDGRPFWVSKEVNNKDSNKGNLFAYLTAAGTTLATIEEALNATVSMTPRLKKSGWPTVDNVSGLPPLLAGNVPELRNEALFFDFYEDIPDMETWQKLPEKTQEKVLQALDVQDYPFYNLAMALVI